MPGEVAVRAALGWGRGILSRGREQIAQLPPPPVPRLDTPLASPETRQRVKRGVVFAVSGAAVVVLALGLWAWWPRLRTADSRAAANTAAVLPPASVPIETAPQYPKEVQDAIAQLPHLSPRRSSS